MEYTLNPVTVEATQCLWCWPQAISDREARTEDMLRTLTITGRRASFTMGGMTFDIPQARNEKAGSPEETVQMICRDATRLVRTGSGRYKFGAGGLFLGMSFHAGAWEFYTGEGASPENWAPMQVASSEAVVGYAIWTGLGCGNSKIRP